MKGLNYLSGEASQGNFEKVSHIARGLVCRKVKVVMVVEFQTVHPALLICMASEQFSTKVSDFFD